MGSSVRSRAAIAKLIFGGICLLILKKKMSISKSDTCTAINSLKKYLFISGCAGSSLLRGVFSSCGRGAALWLRALAVASLVEHGL